jgi:hypothetical protein
MMAAVLVVVVVVVVVVVAAVENGSWTMEQVHRPEEGRDLGYQTDEQHRANDKLQDIYVVSIGPPSGDIETLQQLKLGSSYRLLGFSWPLAEAKETAATMTNETFQLPQAWGIMSD